MLGKITELSGISSPDGFEVIYGIDVYEDGRRDLGFVSLEMGGEVFSNRTHVTYIIGYCLDDSEQESFKKYHIGICEENQIPEEISEEYLFVIIQYSSGIETTCKRLAGRNPTEAILKMHEGDTVKVSKAGGISETYMVVKAGNELFLVKKNR